MSICEVLPTAPRDRRRLLLRSPVDLEVLGSIECADASDIASALERARLAQRAWANVSPKERAKVVLRARDVVLARQDEIVATVLRETGKAPADALNVEIFSSLDAMTFYARRAAKTLAPKRCSIHGLMGLFKTLRITYKPLGVIGIITPWNGPFVLSITPTTQALLAGNAVILKGSEVTPESTKLVEHVYREAGLPEGLLQVLYGDGGTGAALIEGGVQKISFTGSVATGRKVGEACGRRLIPCSLELGGNGAMLVCSDAALELATDAALFGSCINSGHYCCGTQRVYVVESLYESFVARVAEKARSLRQGSALGLDEDVGAVFWDRQLRTIETHVADAVGHGARLLVGGRRNPGLKGLYYEPTVLADCDESMLVMHEETFGPVVCIQKVRDEAEGVAKANDSAYGLACSVIGRNREKAFELALQLETGSVCINDIAVTYGIPEAPFGGVKASGIGQVNGASGPLGYCHALPVILNRFSMSKLPGAYPYSASGVATTKRIMRWLWGPKLGSRSRRAIRTGAA